MSARALIDSALRIRKIAHSRLRMGRAYAAVGKPHWQSDEIESAREILNNCRWILWRARNQSDFHTVVKDRKHELRRAA